MTAHTVSQMIGNAALCWFQLYLSSRKQYVRRGPVSHLPDVRRATRVRSGPNPLHPVCGRSLIRLIHSQPRIATAHVCRLHSGVWIVLTDHGTSAHSKHHRLHWSSHVLDAIKQASPKTEILWCVTIQHQLSTSPLLIDSTAAPSLQSSLPLAS